MKNEKFSAIQYHTCAYKPLINKEELCAQRMESKMQQMVHKNQPRLKKRLLWEIVGCGIVDIKTHNSRRTT